jgi:sphingolipid 4-desaturase/C4-monooxygenase
MDEGRDHRGRRAAILRDHPAVKRLFGPCPTTALFAVIVVAGQLALVAAVAGGPWWLVLGAAYGIGAFLAHYLNAVVHECSHNLVFRATGLNKALGIFANLPGVLPSAVAFRHYHLLHHRFPGRPRLDADVPLRWEIDLVGRSRLGKLLWLLAQPLTYSVVHPLHVRRRIALDRWLLANSIVVLAASATVLVVLGPASLAYLALSVYFAVGPHPTGAHILQEHIVFEGSYETASYYGPINTISINIGLHLEHHDFPNVAGSNLAELRRIAPQYYAGRFSHRSRLATLWRFIMDPRIALDSRVIRAA